MSLAEEFHLIVAAETVDGPDFVEPGPPLVRTIPGVVESAWFWAADTPPTLPNQIGTTPTVRGFPSPGGFRFGVFRFPARSSGLLDIRHAGGAGVIATDNDDLGMHRSASVDIEVILSGRVDLLLPGGRRRVLSPGSILIMGGVDHAWSNHYDEDCTYLGVILGTAQPT